MNDGKDRNEETQVPDTVHYKCFFRGISVVEIFKPVTDQQVRAKPHAFPPNEHDHEIGAHHQQQHRKNKQVQVRKIPGIVRRRFFLHIGGGINMDQESDTGDDEQE